MKLKWQKKKLSVCCPKCKKSQEVDATMKKAFCQYCGMQFAFGEVEQPQAETQTVTTEKKSNLETIFGFVEKQQNRMEEKRQRRMEEKRRQEEEARQRRKEFLEKYGWLVVVGVIAFVVLIAVAIAKGY